MSTKLEYICGHVRSINLKLKNLEKDSRKEINKVLQENSSTVLQVIYKRNPSIFVLVVFSYNHVDVGAMS